MSAAEKANIIKILTKVQSSAPNGCVSDYAKRWQFCPYQQWCRETYPADVCRLSARVEMLIVIIKMYAIPCLDGAGPVTPPQKGLVTGVYLSESAP